MRSFNPRVSEAEYMAAAQPSPDDVALLAYCLGATLAIELPRLRCLRITQEVTENARLRYMLGQAIREVEQGESGFLLERFSIHPDLVPLEFLDCLKEDRDVFVYDQIPPVAVALLHYASNRFDNAAFEFSRRIERPPALQEFADLAGAPAEDEGSFLDMLDTVEEMSSPETRGLIECLRREFAEDESVSNAFYVLNLADALYMHIVDRAAEQGRLCIGFHLLSTSVPP